MRSWARRKKRLTLYRHAVLPASGCNQSWSMDFVHDELVTGRTFRVLTVINRWSRESVLMEAAVALTGQRVVNSLEALSAHRPLPPAIQVDHGTEFTSKALDEWPIDAASRWTSVRETAFRRRVMAREHQVAQWLAVPQAWTRLP